MVQRYVGKRTLLSGGLLDGAGSTDTDKAVARLELLQGLSGVVDESETSGLATTVVGAETEDGDLVLAGLVELSKLAAEVILGDVGLVGVQDVTVGKERKEDWLATAFRVSALMSRFKMRSPMKSKNRDIFP